MSAVKKHGVLVHNIPTSSIQKGSAVDFDVYIKQEGKYNMFLKQGEQLQSSQFNKFECELDSIHLYVKASDKQLYNDYLNKHISDFTKDPTIPLREKSQMVYSSASNIINELFEKPESKEAIEQSKGLVTNTIDVILSDEKSIKSIMEIGSHDYYTYTHSVDVSVFAIGFASYLKFSQTDLSNIGYAAMMHDIGKSKIPSEIINKQGKLSDDEFNIMKNHPVFSYEILQFHNENNSDILKGARNHHEKALGNGYPDKLNTDQTHLFAKIIAISDIFSALTTKRSYKDAYSSFETHKMMKEKMLDDIDKNLFIEFIKFMKKSAV